MSLDTLLRENVDQAFDELGDIVKKFVLARSVNTSYDPSTGNASSTPNNISCRGLLTSVEPEMVDGDIVRFTDSCIFLISSQEPENADTLQETESNDVHTVIKSQKVFGDLFKVIVREVEQ